MLANSIKKPDCFDSQKDFEVWKRLNYRITLAARAKTVCDDCPADFEAKMVDQGRCMRKSMEKR